LEINNWKTKQADSESEAILDEDDETDENQEIKIENLPIT